MRQRTHRPLLRNVHGCRLLGVLGRVGRRHTGCLESLLGPEYRIAATNPATDRDVVDQPQGE